jgi:hypothetical protein
MASWVIRERQGRRREPKQVLSAFADLFAADRFMVAEPILAQRWLTMNDVLRAGMVQRKVAEVLLDPVNERGNLPTIGRTKLILLTG